MNIFASNKIKIIVSVIGSCCLILGVGIPYLMSSFKQKELKTPEQPPQLPPEPAPIIKPPKPAPENIPSEESMPSKVNALKNKKIQFLSSVETSTSIYKNSIGDVTSAKQLEERLKQCSSINKVSANVTDNEKTNLKNSYDQVKADIQEFDKIRSIISTGELKTLEQEVDKRNDDEGKYNNFKNKLEETQQKYEHIINKKSDSRFSTLLNGIKSKLNPN